MSLINLKLATLIAIHNSTQFWHIISSIQLRPNVINYHHILIISFMAIHPIPKVFWAGHCLIFEGPKINDEMSLSKMEVEEYQGQSSQ